MGVSSFCKREVLTIWPSATIREAAKMMSEGHVGDLVVTETNNSRPIGLITDRDIVRFVVAHGANAENVKVEDIMSRTVYTIEESKGIGEAIETMHEYGVRRLPVVDKKGYLKGIVTVDDMLDMLAGEFNHLARVATYQVKKEARSMLSA